MMEVTHTGSSVVSRVSYNRKQMLLEVTLKGGEVYTYKNVPLHVFNEFFVAPSLGSFFSKNIRTKYEVVEKDV